MTNSLREVPMRKAFVLMILMAVMACLIVTSALAVEISGTITNSGLQTALDTAAASDTDKTVTLTSSAKVDISGITIPQGVTLIFSGTQQNNVKLSGTIDNYGTIILRGALNTTGKARLNNYAPPGELYVESGRTYGNNVFANATIIGQYQHVVHFFSWDNVVYDAKIVYHNSLVSPPDNIPTREGHSFISWDWDFTTPVTSELNIFAQWEKKSQTFMVEFWVNGELFDSQEVKAGGNAIEPEGVISPEGLCFDMWKWDKDFTNVQEDLTVTALFAYHAWSEWTETTSAACEDDGEETRTCDICGEKETRTIEALGHDDNVVTVDATCEADGSITTTCSRCDYRGMIVLTKLGHNWDDGVVTKAATCYEEGERTYTCLRDGCNTTKTEVIAIYHTGDDYCPDCNSCDACGGCICLSGVPTVTFFGQSGYNVTFKVENISADGEFTIWWNGPGAIWQSNWWDSTVLSIDENGMVTFTLPDDLFGTYEVWGILAPFDNPWSELRIIDYGIVELGKDITCMIENLAVSETGQVTFDVSGIPSGWVVSVWWDTPSGVNNWKTSGELGGNNGKYTFPIPNVVDGAYEIWAIVSPSGGATHDPRVAEGIDWIYKEQEPVALSFVVNATISGITVWKVNTNQTGLTITVTETLSDGSKVAVTQTFIYNDAYTKIVDVGGYKIQVRTSVTGQKVYLDSYSFVP